MAAPIIKQPAETLFVPILAGRGATAAIVAAVTARGLVAGAALPVVTAAVVGDAVRVNVLGGDDGERYLATILADLPGGAKAEEEIEVAVIDAGWALPDGGAPYVSIADFVRIVGLAETVTMTDGDGSGRIDRDYLTAALTAAQSEADVYLAARYVVPLITVPEIVKTAIVDRARLRLYPRGAPEGAAAQARSAEQLLVRISDGKLPLPLPAGGIATAEASPTPIIISSRGRRAYPNGLRDVL